MPPVTVTAKKPVDVTDTNIIEEPVALEPVTVTAKREETPALDPVTVTAKKPTDITDTNIIEEPVATEETPPEETPKDKPYKPNLFILGGKQPKAPTSNAVLSQALGVSTGAAASRGAGEIEDPSTGKKRKNVWNEESLRLKDALGI